MRPGWRAKAAIFLYPVLVLHAGCSRRTDSANADAADPLLVQALQVKPEPVPRRVELVGTLEGEREVTLSSEVAGRVVAIRADLGDRVREGQVLIELDPTEFRLEVERQHAALRAVLARLGMESEEDRLPEPGETSIVRRAAGELAEARANYERARKLLAEGVVSEQVYDSAEARHRTADAAYTGALEEVRNLAAQVENLRAQLGIARESLADASIRAPFAGTVRKRLVELGQYVRSETALVSLASTNPLKLRADVPERWFPYVQAGASVEVGVEAYPEEIFPGRVARVGRAVDPASRTFAIEALVENSPERLRPGVFARAVLTTSRVDSILRVPAAAVVSFYGVQKIYAIESGMIREHVVKLGDRFGDQIEVSEGLPAGSWIATSELTRLRQGSRVQVRKES